MANVSTVEADYDGTADGEIIAGYSTQYYQNLGGGGGNDVLIGGYGPIVTDSVVNNNSINRAQILDNSGYWTTGNSPLVDTAPTTPRTAVLGTGAGAFDYFAVTLGAGANMQLDVDFASGFADPGSTDLLIQVVNASGTVLASSDDADYYLGGAGSVTALDPFLNFHADTAGVYYIRVSVATGGSGSVIPAGASYFLNVAATGHANSGPATALGTELRGEAGNDVLVGHGGGDYLEGGADNDRIYGGDGFDSLQGGDGNDELYGGAGQDQLNGGTGDDVIDGGADFDSVGYYFAQSAVTVSLAITTAQSTGGGGVDTVRNVEAVYGSDYNDTLTGDDDDNHLNGAGGDDHLNGGGGNDLFDVGVDNGHDVMDGGSGRNVIVLDNLTAGWTINLGAGYGSDGLGNTISFTNVTDVSGSYGDDDLTGGLNSSLYGYDGNDTIHASVQFQQTLDGGSGTDTLDLSSDTRTGVAVSVNITTGGSSLPGSYYNFENVRGANADYSIAGTTGANTFTTGSGNDYAIGYEGNDFFSLGGGSNTMIGGEGFDYVSYAFATKGVSVTLAVEQAQGTGVSTDKIVGVEALIGSAYGDQLTGNAGNNVLQGNAGDDILNGGAGDDQLSGATGIDWAVYGGAGSAVTVSLATIAQQDTGGAGRDTLMGIDNLAGSNYNDRLTGNSGDNVLQGLFGADTLSGGLGNDTLDGGDGINTADYSGATGGVTVSLLIAGAQNTGADGTDTLIGIQNLTGSAFDDTLTGDGGTNTLNGGLGNDRLVGGPGNDTLIGRQGTDTVDYSAATSAVAVDLGLTTAQSTGGGGTDTIATVEGIVGTKYADTLTGNSANNTITGGGGNDLIEGGLGNDLLDAGLGVDTVSYAHASAGVIVNIALTTAQATGAAGGTDTLWNFEGVIGSAYNDLLTGNDKANVISGGAGNDTVNGGLGADRLTGEAGQDSFYFASTLGSANIDTITDFSVADDTVQLNHGIFLGLANGVLAAAAFRTGTGAQDADDRIIYNSSTGALLFDRDGSGSAYAAVQFATVGTGLAITAADFKIV